jgi:retron-type reverse transcriptase
LMAALRKHCQEPWILLYVERWLKAPMQTTDELSPNLGDGRGQAAAA